MSDRFPPPPSLPTIPAPKDDDPIRLMRELRAALENMSALAVRLSTSLSCHEMAILAVEHKSNTALDRLDEVRARLGKIEDFLGMAAE